MEFRAVCSARCFIKKKEKNRSHEKVKKGKKKFEIKSNTQSTPRHVDSLETRAQSKHDVIK